MRRILSMLLALLVLPALLLPGAGGAATPVRVGIVAIVGNLPLYCMIEFGGAAADGIEVQTTELTSGNKTVEALAAGAVDIAFGATFSMLQAAQQGLDLVIIAPAAFKATDNRPPTSAIVARKDAGITGPAQLKGKTISVNALRSLDYLIVSEYLTRGGVSPRDVTWRELAYQHVGPALEQGRIDAAVVAEPSLTVMLDGGRVAVLTTALDIIPGTPTTSYAAMRTWTRANGRELEAFLRALRRGVDACTREPQKMREALLKHYRAKPELVQRIGLPVLRSTVRAADIQPVVDLGRRHGLIDRPLDVEHLLSPGAPPR